ncbi:MAG: hypothetical protein AAGI69_24350 [Cyanobacteria bacterium P01_H01_bin.21]
MTLVKPRLPQRFPIGLRGIIILSVALHGGLLLLPMPQWSSPDPEPEVVAEESGAIALTTLPATLPVLPEVPAAAPVEQTVEPPPPVQVPETIPEIDDSVIDDTVMALEDEPADDPIDQTAPVEDEDVDPQTSEPEAGIAFQFSNDFPHLAGSQVGCYGLENCRMAEGQNYVDAVQEIRDNLEAQGYVLTRYQGNDDSDVRNHRIYEMRLPENPETEVKYLNVFGEGLKTAIYIITTRIVTQDELQTLGTSSQG